MSQPPPLISIIIPCYNQAHFLAEAVESALAQTYQNYEILVIDDGSTDNTVDIAGRYPAVRYIRQENQGLSAARNTGIRHSQGDYLLFLDADDRLLPQAIEEGLKAFDAHPESAFVFGGHRLITREGKELGTKSPERKPREGISDFAWLLQGNHIGMHATVLYRRSVFVEVGGFNNKLAACEDYDLYLRISRQYPIASHDHLVAEYRQHEGNMSRDIPLMLATVLAVLRLQQPYVREQPLYKTMYRRGFRNWIYYYSKEHVQEVVGHLKRRAWRRAFQTGGSPIRYAILRSGKAIKGVSTDLKRGLSARWQREVRLPVQRLNFGQLRRVIPAGRDGDGDQERTIQRYYIQRVLDRYAEEIRGQVLQISSRLAGDRNKAIQTTLGVQEFEQDADKFSPNSFDSILLVQSLHHLYNLRQTLKNCYRILKPGGVLLATLPGMPPQDCSEEGYWFFTNRSAQRLFAEVFPPANIRVETYGNVLAATALLHGLPTGELQAAELNHADPQYQILISVRAEKSGSPRHE